MIRVGLVLVHRSLPMLLPDGWIILDVTNFTADFCSRGLLHRLSPFDVFSRKRDGTAHPPALASGWACRPVLQIQTGNEERPSGHSAQAKLTAKAPCRQSGSGGF